jgi:hypothetical protein
VGGIVRGKKTENYTYKRHFLLECDAMHPDKCLSTFRMNVLPPSSSSKGNSSKQIKPSFNEVGTGEVRGGA